MQDRTKTDQPLFVVRLYDGFDNEWMDISGNVPREEAERILSDNTDGGIRNTTFDDIDYYRIFPADTKMIFGRESVVNHEARKALGLE